MFFRARIIDEWTGVELYDAYERVYTAGSRTAVFYHKDNYEAVIRNFLKKSQAPELLPDRYMLEYRALLLPTHNFLFDIFDRKLQRYIEADLINYNNRRWYESFAQKMIVKHEEKFAVLNLRELEAGFVVCMAPLFLGILVFLVEWMITFKNLMVFMCIFDKYFNMKKFEDELHIYEISKKCE